MKFRSHLASAFLVIAVALASLSTAPARAAEAGEVFVNSTGTLLAGQRTTIEFYGGSVGNLQFSVSGGAAGDSVRATLQLEGSPSWTARTGETVWGYANIPAQRVLLTLENSSASVLSYGLNIYGLDTLPRFGENLTTLSGVAQSQGLQSAVQVNAQQSGLYRFALGAGAGSYQLVVDGGAVIKTVVAGAAPSSDDATYFLAAGVHTLQVIQQASVATTEWSVAVQPVGGTDALPASEESAQLGGGAFFAEERIPLQLATAQPVNIRVAVAGGATDSVTVELYNGGEKIYTSSPVFGGEVAWGSSNLVAGANALRVVAKNGNAAALRYAVQITPVATTPMSWEGVSFGATQHAGDGISQIALNFPSDGLYRFTLGAGVGRYQLVLNGNYLRRTVTTAGAEFTAFVAAGSQTLAVVQDTAQVQTTWSVAIAPAEQVSDALPFSSRSGTLGGAGNAFREEWIPVNVAAGAPVNLRIAASGAATDALLFEVYNADSKVYTAEKVYGGEVFWGSSALTAGKNLVHVVALEGNVGQMAFEFSLNAVAAVPSSWGGNSRGTGLQSTISLNAPVSGTYLVTITVESGAGLVRIDPGTTQSRTRGVSPTSTVSVLRVPLKAGPHTFVFQQDAAVEATAWSVSTALRKADETEPAVVVPPPPSSGVKLFLPLSIGS
ncbi:MAG: hypothetical protein H7Z42_21825 [Roseiflexaceae bacterium]|nr:hypothetical protein [Roseiflexaceae bacterium]